MKAEVMAAIDKGVSSGTCRLWSRPSLAKKSKAQVPVVRFLLKGVWNRLFVVTSEPKS